MSEAIARIEAYLAELDTRIGLDREVIQTLRPPVLGEISLRVADLKTLLQSAQAQR